MLFDLKKKSNYKVFWGDFVCLDIKLSYITFFLLTWKRANNDHNMFYIIKWKRHNVTLNSICLFQMLYL